MLWRLVLACGLIILVTRKSEQLKVSANSESKIIIAEDNHIKNTHKKEIVNPRKCEAHGPGLFPHKIVLPARYFHVQLVDHAGHKLNTSEEYEDDLKVRIDCNGEKQVWTQVLNRGDGSFIVRYKVYQSCFKGFRIIVTFKNKHVAQSPYTINYPVHPDNCYCPRLEASRWLLMSNCSKENQQLEKDLEPFSNVDFDAVLKDAIDRFYRPASHSFCHYAVKDNKIYRQCYGQHVGFHIFPDAILLSLTRKVYLPDVEFLINLGDWPFIDVNRVQPLIPIFSWCKSNTTADILLPTYEITEASLEAMGRVSLDMMTVQSNSEVHWENKIPKLFWRGRDSRKERLDLVQLSRKHPDLFNVSLTNFFFFRDQEHIYGPKAPHVSFFKFFNYKYQLNIDGTVAAYRFPFLLGGDSVVLKTESQYFEHFYKDLKPWTHYVPVQAQLEDLVEKVQWLKDHDEEALKIGQNGRRFAQENLMPLNIFCYHVQAFKEWATRLKNPVEIRPEMELVKQPDLVKPTVCECLPSERNIPEDELKDEL